MAESSSGVQVISAAGSAREGVTLAGGGANGGRSDNGLPLGNNHLPGRLAVGSG